jgi:D-lactate dehydrogenase (cytochrome)
LGIVLGSVGSGLLGYTVAQAHPASRAPLHDVLPTYGTPEDFQSAIKDLRVAFPAGDAVSTDLDDLHMHGFSENDHHPGAWY